MARQIAGIDLGAVIQGALGGEPLVLGVRTSGAASVDPNAAPEQVTASHRCRGYPGAIRRSSVKDSLVRERMVIFGIYGNTLPSGLEPDVGNLVTDVRGRIHEVYFVDGDSVEGVWVLYTTRTG